MIALVWAAIAGACLAADGVSETAGRVVDSDGRPIAGASVAPMWSANGTHRRDDGGALDLADPEQLKLFWGRVGRMEPMSTASATTGEDGRFSIPLGRRQHFALAIDPDRRLGGIGRVAKGREDELMEIKLRPLVRVRGRMALAGTGEAPAWCHAYAELPEVEEWPLDSFRVASCGSFDGRFAMSLPPGEYVLDAYGVSGGDALDEDTIDVRVRPAPRFTLSGVEPEVDLGTLTLDRFADPGAGYAKAKADGTLGDSSRFHGRRPPPLSIDDARGVARDVQPWSFPGKWVVLEFWGFSCPHCFLDGLPELAAFYREHAGSRDRFEVLAICIDLDGELKTIEDVDRRLAPIVKNVWDGEALPFPILLDSSWRTMEAYGLPGFPTLLLIDPDGNLVPGGLEALAQELKRDATKSGGP